MIKNILIILFASIMLLLDIFCAAMFIMCLSFIPKEDYIAGITDVVFILILIYWSVSLIDFIKFFFLKAKGYEKERVD